MSQAKQKQGIGFGLFSSALFCLWLSTASLLVWMDLGNAPPSQTSVAQQPAAKPGLLPRLVALVKLHH
jgi:hypothetical protein